MVSRIAAMADIGDALGRVPLFSGIKAKERKKLAARLGERTFTEGETVITEGQSGVGFFVIEEGNASVSVKGEIVRTLGPGEYFGEIALIDSGPRSASVVATTDLRCRGMTAWEFRPFVEEHPEVAWALLETLTARLRAAEGR
jgi:CRP/FNR family cyclic AMP-dependent transcriptional regulator